MYELEHVSNASGSGGGGGGGDDDDDESTNNAVKSLSRNPTVGKLADHYPHYALLEIKFWISQQSVIPELSDRVIQVFLHSCSYSLPDTKSTILSFYKLRMKLPLVFSDRNMDFVKSASNKMYCVRLPGVTEEGYTVFYLSLRDTSDAANFSFTDSCKFVLMALEMWIFLEDAYPPGVIFVLDSNHLTFSHLKHINKGILKPIFQYCQDALATRVKKIIILNASTPVDIVLDMVELIVSNKMMNLIEKHGKGNTRYLDSKLEHILPTENGGECENDINILQNKTIQQLEENLEWFKKEDDVLKNLIMKHPPRRRSIFENIFNGSSAVPH